MTGPSLKYPGAKWRVADWILSLLPAHQVYVEPYFGSGAIFFNKRPSKSEYLNDINAEVVNLFKVMREHPDRLVALLQLTPYARDEYERSFEPTSDPIEQARRTLVRHWMSMSGNGGARYKTGWRHNGKKAARSKNCPQEWARLPDRVLQHAARLKDAHIEHRPALELLGRLNYPHTLAYIDPPYHPDVRTGRMYAEEMLDEAQHVELLEFLTQDWQGMAVVSGYAHPLYDDALADWQRFSRQTAAEMGQTRTEVLWLSPNCDHSLFAEALL